MSTPSPADPADPAETAWIAEVERQNIARALDQGELLIWPDGTAATVIGRLDQMDALTAERDRLRSQRDAALALADELEREAEHPRNASLYREGFNDAMDSASGRLRRALTDEPKTHARFNPACPRQPDCTVCNPDSDDWPSALDLVYHRDPAPRAEEARDA